MKVRLRQLICELCFWLLAELALGYIEMDNLADYCEFLKKEDEIAFLKKDDLLRKITFSGVLMPSGSCC